MAPIAERSLALGIKLGTDASCISVIEMSSLNETVSLNELPKAELIANEDGDRSIPTCVAFDGEDKVRIPLVDRLDYGDAGKVPTHAQPQIHGDGISKFSHPLVAHHLKTFQVDIVDVEGMPHYEIQTENGVTTMSPVEMTSHFINSLKTTAENYKNLPVTSVAITHPMHFESHERAALVQAAKNASIPHLHVISEPVALMTALFDCKTLSQMEQTVIVVDVGGSSTDVALLRIHSGLITVLSNKLDNQLGGQDFDALIVEHCVGDYKRKTKVDVSSNARSMMKLRNAAEIVKKALSTRQSGSISVESIYDGMDYNESIHRGRFEGLGLGLVRRIVDLVGECIKSAGMEKSDIEQAFLIGGCMKIPMVKAAVSEILSPIQLHAVDFDPIEITAIGAAREAFMIHQMVKKHPNSKAALDASLIVKPKLSCLGHSISLVFNTTQEKIAHVLSNSGHPIPLSRKLSSIAVPSDHFQIVLDGNTVVLEGEIPNLAGESVDVQVDVDEHYVLSIHVHHDAHITEWSTKLIFK